jgi:hypothetical protein
MLGVCSAYDIAEVSALAWMGCFQPMTYCILTTPFLVMVQAQPQKQREIPVAVHRENYSRMVGIGTNCKQQRQGQIKVTMKRNRCRYSEDKARDFQ